jgi:hypothetical protein
MSSPEPYETQTALNYPQVYLQGPNHQLKIMPCRVCGCYGKVIIELVVTVRLSSNFYAIFHYLVTAP